MAKVTVTFEDTVNEGVEIVKVVSDPSYETMMAMNTSGHLWTAAQGMALFALNKIREESKRNAPTKIWLPKIGR